MPTVAEPLWGQEAPDADLQEAAAPAIDIETALLLASLVARLQRVVTNTPGDRAFLKDVRGKRPELLSPAQRAQIMRLAWRYRFQLPQGLRPGADPDRPGAGVS